MLALESPYPQFFDLDGRPLDAGYVYIGLENQNPETNPVPVYWDAELTQVAPQPLRTKNGFIARNGTIAQVYVGSNHSMTVRNVRRALVYTAKTSKSWNVSSQIDEFINDIGGPDGASQVGFRQQGEGAIDQDAQRKLQQFVDLEDYGDVDKTGATDATDVFALAVTRAAELGKGVRLPVGTVLLDPATIPTALPALEGRGSSASTLKFARGALPSGQILLNASSNTAGLRISGLSIDCDDAVFKTAGAYVLVLNGSNNWVLDDVRIVGRGQSGVFTNASSGGVARNLIIDCTGAAGASFHTGFEGQNCFNVVVQMRTTGLPAYSGTFGSGSFFSKFQNCHTEGTSGSFGYSLGGTAYCGIYGCTARNTSHEAFQITDGYYNTIDQVICEWDNDKGVDAGISVHGKTVQTRLNRVSNATIINSYGPGLLCADNAQGNSFSDCILKDCSVRGYAAAPDPSSAVIGQYTEMAGVQCTGQTFRDLKILTETGPVLNGYSEANNGAGATISDTNLIDIEWQGGGTITKRYKTLTAGSAKIWDLDHETIPLTVSAGSGAISSYSASMDIRRRGPIIEIPRVGIQITSAGTGAGDLTVLWPGAPNAASNGGALNGREHAVSGKMAGGAANAGGVVVRLADNTTAIATGAHIVMSGSYRIA